MERIHLFELEDQGWFPSFLRNYGTDFLGFVAEKTGMFKPVIPLLEKGLKLSGENKIIDLGSGSGGGIFLLNSHLKQKIPKLQILLTDLFPNIPAFELAKSQSKNISFVTTPIDARVVPEELIGMRTLFLAFHHFKPFDAKLILQDAVDNKDPIAIFEGQERSFRGFIGMLFSPIFVLLATPFIRPFSIGRIIFTYLLPIVPLFVLWDGLVSSLRTYSVKEMNALVLEVKNNDKFIWETGRLKSGPGVILYLLGIPKENAVNSIPSES